MEAILPWVYASRKRIGENDASCTFDSNSLLFVGGDYERNFYPFVVDTAYAVKFLGMKFHGRLPSDEPTGVDPAPVDLLQILGSSRIAIEGCQIANARNYSIYAGGNLASTPVPSSVAIIGCTFAAPANYTKDGMGNFIGAAWNVVVDRARCIVDDNFFAEGLITTPATMGPPPTPAVYHPSYAVNGGDVWLKSNVIDAAGSNQHFGTAGTDLKRDYTNVYRRKSVGGFDFAAPTGKTLINAMQLSDTNSRFQIQAEGRLRFGDGTNVVDCVIERKSANLLGLAAGDSFQVDGTFDGGLLRLGPYRIWVNPANDNLMIKKNSDPGTVIDGVVVGTQT